MKEITNIFLVLIVNMLCVISTLQAQVMDESYCPMDTIEESETSAKLMSTCNPSTDICTGKYHQGRGYEYSTLLYFICY